MHRYIVEEAKLITPGTLRLTLKPKSDEHIPFVFYPGQYAAISFRSTNGRFSVARCFSMASDPHNLETLQFGIRVGGKFTTKLSKVQVGEEVLVRGPFGGFVIDHETQKDLVFVAGGIGITPFISMLRAMHTTKDSTPTTLFYGVRGPKEIPFFNEINEISKDLDNLKVTYVLGEGDPKDLPGHEVATGFVNYELLEKRLGQNVAGKSIFVCGPPPLMNGVVAAAHKLGIPKSEIVTEAFRQGHHRQSGKVISWPKNMYVMGAVGVVLGSTMILASDIAAKLPSAPLKDADDAKAQLKSSESTREADLDKLVNTLSADANATKAASPAATKAVADAKNATTTTQQPATSAPTAASPMPTTTTTQTSTIKNTTTQPKCTTTQSGVTTCI